MVQNLLLISVRSGFPGSRASFWRSMTSPGRERSGDRWLGFSPCIVPNGGLLYIHICIYRGDVESTWDERKNRVNQRKHGVSCETAIWVFDDPFHLSHQDREVGGEARWQTIGMAQGVRIVVVAHTVEQDEKMIRVLSARKATPRERGIHAQG
jgi:uncharacterized DUF497 family protein